MSRPKHRRTSYFVGLNLFDRLEGFPDLEARIAALPTEQDRGDAFEVFAEAYLATQKLVGAEEVWPAEQVPIGVLRACCLPIKDMGADGVYVRGCEGPAFKTKVIPSRAAIDRALACAILSRAHRTVILREAVRLTIRVYS